MKLTLLILSVILAGAYCDCGCLKCSKNLRVVSNPRSPCKIIYRGVPCEQQRPLSYTLQAPVPNIPVVSIPKSYGYKIQAIDFVEPIDEPCATHGYQLQTPVITPPKVSVPITGLVTRPDRIVLPAPECPPCNADVQDRKCNPILPPRPICTAFPQIQLVQQPIQQILPVQYVPRGPIIEKLPEDFYRRVACDCRYSTNSSSRKKRHLPLLTKGVHMFMRFLRLPLETLRHLHHPRNGLHSNFNKVGYHDGKTVRITPEQMKMLHYYEKLERQQALKQGVGGLKQMQNGYLGGNQAVPTWNRFVVPNGRVNQIVAEPLKGYQYQVPLKKYQCQVPLKQEPNVQYQYSVPLKKYQFQQQLVAEPVKQYRYQVPKYGYQQKLVEEPVKQYQIQEPFKKCQNLDSTLLSKLVRLNRAEQFERTKRSIVLDENGELSLPFLRVTDLVSSSEEEDDDNDENEEDIIKIREKLKNLNLKSNRDEYLEPLNFDHLVPHNPIFYILNTPIRILHHFHKLGEQISPVFKSVPSVFINSKKYLKDFTQTVRNDVLNFASNLIGDFDESPQLRYRRSTNFFEPEYSNVFNRSRREIKNRTNFENFEPDYTNVFPNRARSKRYILKVVDEDEVESFLREKLSVLAPTTTTDNKKKKKKLVVEKLNSKIIIDNNGRPFVEIGGVKRPLRLKKDEEDKKDEEKKEETTTTTTVKPVSEEQTIDDRISNVIEKAKEKLDEKGMVGMPLHQNEVSTHIIKGKINQILTEIQNLVNFDFDKYEKLYANLRKLQNFKTNLCNDWKKILMDGRHNDISSKIAILNEFRDLQSLRDSSVSQIALILNEDSQFMTKNLIKTLVRLQKLQCVIYKVVDAFSEALNLNTGFNIGKEIKYVDYLCSLNFIPGDTKLDVERDLIKRRDKALEHQLELLEKLRKVISCQNSEIIYEEAKILWEINNIEKLQKATIDEMNTKIKQGLKVRKELKILFDLLKQMEECEEKQVKLLKGLCQEKKEKIVYIDEKKYDRDNVDIKSGRNVVYKKIPVRGGNNKGGNFWTRTILEDKKPVKLVSNGYTMTAYKVSDGFH